MWPGAAWIDVGDQAVVAVAGGRFEAAVQGAGRLILERLTVAGSGSVGFSTQDAGVLDAPHIRRGGFDDPILGRGGQLRVADGYVTGGDAAVRLVSGSGTEALWERCLIADSGGPAVQVGDTTVCTVADSTGRGSHAGWGWPFWKARRQPLSRACGKTTRSPDPRRKLPTHPAQE